MTVKSPNRRRVADRVRPLPCERGVTLVELMISITLVAAISTGMLMSMRTSLSALARTQGRLEENRRTMGMQQTILRQIGGVMPVTGACVPGQRAAAFVGSSGSLRLVTSYSMNEGARGYPRIVEYLVQQEPRGTFQLLMREHLYAGPDSLSVVCAGPVGAAQGAEVAVMAEHLAFARFSYLELIPEALDQGRWMSEWSKPSLPAAVRIDLAPAEANSSRLPVVSLNIPIHVTREVLFGYTDDR